MSEIVIEVRVEGYGMQIPRTHVYIDGKFAYQTMVHPDAEREKLNKLIEMIPIENTIVK